MISLYSFKETKPHLIGGMTELKVNTGIFVTALHVLQKLQPSDIENSMKFSGLNAANYRLFVFSNNRSSENNIYTDIALIIPKAFVGLLFDEGRLKLDLQYMAAVWPSQKFKSWQYRQMQNDSFAQVSNGEVSHLSQDGTYFVIGGANNFSGPASSGSAVFVQGERGWSIGGIVQCKYETGDLSGRTRVVPTLDLFGQKVFSVSAENLKSIKIIFPEGCIPVHGRGGGGL